METAGLAKQSALGLYTSGPRATEVGGPWGDGSPAPAPRNFSEGVSVHLTPTEIGTAYNSTFPSSFNTGGIWEGVGFTPWVKAGAEAEYGWFTLRLQAVVWFSQNGDFGLEAPIPGQGLTNQPLANIGGYSIDQPQRYGTAPFASLNWGNSELKAAIGPGLLSFSTQNLWFGPAVFNPLLLSSQAQGFPHLRLGVDNLDTAIGTFEGNLVYGLLSTSAYWDPTVNNGNRFFGGLFLDYRPSFFPQLTLGLGRTIFSYWNQLDWQVPAALFNFIPWPARYNPFSYGTGESHQHVSLTFRLLFSEVGFEVYGEWGKNDFNSNFMSYLDDLGHQSAYTIGLRKAFVLSREAVLGIGAEIANLSQNLEGLINSNGFYLWGDWDSHFAIREGYTNNGQVLAGGIGNGAAEILYADVYWTDWHWGLELMRYNPETSVPYLNPGVSQENQIDTQIIIVPNLDWRLGNWLFSLSVPVNFDLNRYFDRNNNITNYQVVTSVRYTW